MMNKTFYLPFMFGLSTYKVRGKKHFFSSLFQREFEFRIYFTRARYDVKTSEPVIQKYYIYLNI